MPPDSGTHESEPALNSVSNELEIEENPYRKAGEELEQNLLSNVGKTAVALYDYQAGQYNFLVILSLSFNL